MLRRWSFRPPLPLHLRLLATSIIVVCVALGTVAVFVSRATSNEFQHYVDRDFADFKHLVSPLVVFKLQDYLVRQEHAAEAQAATALERQGDPTSSEGSHGPDLQTAVEQLGQTSGIHLIITDEAQQIIADSHRRPNDDPFPLAIPDGVIIFQGKTLVIYIAPLEDVNNAQNFINTVNRSLLLAVTIAGLVAVFLTLTLSRRILNPIGILTSAARQMEKGDLSHRVPVDSEDEIGELAHAFNAMADGLARLEQLRRNMVSDVAHELRTPLSNIRGYLEAIQDGVALPTSAIINSLHEEALLLNRLIDDLQELALAEAGQIKLVRQPTALQEVVDQVVNVLHPQCIGKGLSLQVNLPHDLPPAYADPKRVGQILRNLLNNAITHTPAGGTITIIGKLGSPIPDLARHARNRSDDLSTSSQSVHAENKTPFIELSVKDTGNGIAPEHLPFIFERFYRVDPSRTRATGGAGLGLAIVNQMVHAHGGQVMVESQVGEGTTFTLTLPAAIEGTRVAHADPSEGHQHGTSLVSTLTTNH